MLIFLDLVTGRTPGAEVQLVIEEDKYHRLPHWVASLSPGSKQIYFDELNEMETFIQKLKQHNSTFSSYGGTTRALWIRDTIPIFNINKLELSLNLLSH